jgi:hypothetical protein
MQDSNALTNLVFMVGALLLIFVFLAVVALVAIFGR